MTLHEKIVLSAYTGILMCDMSEVHRYIEKLLGRPVWTHELASEALWSEIKEKAKPDFHKITDISHAINALTFPNGFEKVEHNGNVYFVERED